jgi:uncharacterized LabA/DUF88 family protein
MNKTLVCVDMSNLHYYLNKKRWQINWEKFRTYLSSLYGKATFIFYDGIRSKSHFMALYPQATELEYYSSVKAKERFFKYLKKIGFIVETKYTVQSCDSDTKELRRKCNFDVEITLDALARINDYEIFVLCTGDRDFLKLIKYLNGQHKKTVLIYPKDRTSRELVESTTGQSITLGSIKHIVGEPIRMDKK